MDEVKHLREKCQELEKMLDILKKALLEIKENDPIRYTKHSYFLIANKALEDLDGAKSK